MRARVQDFAIRLNRFSDPLFLYFTATLFFLNLESPIREVPQNSTHIHPALLLVMRLICVISLCTLDRRQNDF